MSLGRCLIKCVPHCWSQQSFLRTRSRRSRMRFGPILLVVQVYFGPSKPKVRQTNILHKVTEISGGRDIGVSPSSKLFRRVENTIKISHQKPRIRVVDKIVMERFQLVPNESRLPPISGGINSSKETVWCKFGNIRQSESYVLARDFDISQGYYPRVPESPDTPREPVTQDRS